MNKPSEIAVAVERRATLARLSLCLLPIIAAALLAAPMAQAEPLAPALTATNPPSSESSPASSTALRLIGKAEPSEEVITKVVRTPALAGAIASAVPTEHPEYEIEVFATHHCEGGPVETALAGELEGTGIPVTVAANSATTFSARQVDPAEPSSPSRCSNPLTYWEGNPPPGEEPSGGEEGPAGPPPSESSNPPVGVGNGSPPLSPTPPPAAPRLHTSPGGRSNDETPLVAGSAPGAVTVKIFANASCGGPPLAKASAAEFAAGVRVPVAENATTSFSATAVAGSESACSAPVSYVEDSIPPRTRITMGPGLKTRRHRVVFRFTDITEDPPGTTFFCKVDRGKWKQCSSPLRLSHLRFARYVVRVRAIDVAGNVEVKGAKRLFKVVKGS